MDRVAVFGDVHGNLVSLEAVLRDVEREGIGGMVCLGDVAGTGPHPVDVLERIRSLGCRVVMGNVDAWLLAPDRVAPEPGRQRLVHDLDSWCAEQLTDEHRRLLGSFEATVVMTIGGLTLSFVHGSPRSFDDAIRSTTPPEELDRVLGPSPGEVVVCGHTHEPMLRRHRETVLVNPGSVGLPNERLRSGELRNPPWAEYAVIDAGPDGLEVSLRRVAVDAEAVVDAMRASGMPDAEAWAAGWRPPSAPRRDGT